MMKSSVIFRVIVIFLTILRLNSANGETLLDESANSHCGNIFTDKQFVLTSENYPLPYPTGKECFYLLKGGNCTTHFNIEFLDFNLISSIGCIKDRLEIGSQDALCGMRNGSRVYISEKGSLKLKFVSDNNPEKSNRGFKLLVTRVDGCETDNSTTEDAFTVENRNTAEYTTEPVQFEWTTKRIPTKPNPSYLPSASKPCCQNNIYSSKTFLLVSPNFPYTINTPADCTYIIRKASSLVCRLRINVLFFSLGPTTQNACPHGHLEIDGKYICGCNSDLKLTASFQNTESKILRFRSSGYSTNGASGFLLEVIQDECQKRYSPENDVVAGKSTGEFRFYRDQFNRVKWPQNNNIDQLKLVRQRSYYLPPEGNEVEKQFGNVYKHFFFFAPEDQEESSWTQNTQEKEETNYIEISTINTLLTNVYYYQQCMQWNANQFVSLQRRYGDRLNQICKLSQQTANDEDNCLVLSSLSGSLTSPGYPIVYPVKKNFCYRFKMSAGYCAVQLFFKDFQIERSYDCLKDYLAINQYRYCGNYLTNKQVTISARGKSHQDLKFVSDANYCGKGFSAVYQQVRCQKPDDNSITPINCNPGGENDDENPFSCGKAISDKYFVIKNDDAANSCTYSIEKYSENVCKVQLNFERLNLPCQFGSITINDRVFCGERSGQSEILNILDRITIVYRRNNNYRPASNTFLIRGEQIDTECETFTPDPVRLISTGPKEATKSVNSYPDVCALIKEKVSTKDLPKKVCDILIKYHNALECNFSKAILLDAHDSTRNNTKILLFNEDSATTIYKEIEC